MEQVRKFVYDQIFDKIIYLKGQLYGMRMKEGMNIEDHLNVFNTCICHLTSMDIKIDDEDTVVNLLCTLPESWGQVVSSISVSTIDTLEFVNVVRALLSEESRKKSSFETSSPEAFIVRGRSKERGEKSRVLPGQNQRAKRAN